MLQLKLIPPGNNLIITFAPLPYNRQVHVLLPTGRTIHLIYAVLFCRLAVSPDSEQLREDTLGDVAGFNQ